MSINYIEYHFEITPKEPATEILIAELGELPFESFEETENGLRAYIPVNQWNNNILDDIFILTNPDFSIKYNFKKIQQVNWNEEWEKNFNPISVDDICVVRATFHEPTNAPYEIIIDPKMSFGTGHHETTFLMLQMLLQMDFSEKKVLDMGCGTGILAIMAAKKGAKNIDAVDIDPWCVENTQENIKRNNVDFINVFLGDASFLENKSYDVIIANINRNILLEDIPAYAKSLPVSGLLLISGFYDTDLEILQQKALENNLRFIEKKEKNAWIVAKFEKF